MAFLTGANSSARETSMQKKDDGDTVSNASKIKLDRTSVLKRVNQASQTKSRSPLELDAVVCGWSLSVSLCVGCWDFLVGNMVRDNGGRELEETGSGVDVVADVAGIEQQLPVCTSGGGGFRRNFTVPTPLLFPRN